MFQIKYECGKTLVVIGKGENGLSRIDDSNGQIVYQGGYQDCIKWLDDRNLSVAKLQR